MSTEPVREINLELLTKIQKYSGDILSDPDRQADFRRSARLAFSGQEGYVPESALITAAFQGFKKLGFDDGEEVIDMVKKGLEAFGVAVLSS